MTCIVGLEHKGKVYIGGDSAGVSMGSLARHTRSDEKVFINENMLMGFTTSFRMGQLLRYALKIPKHPKTKDDMEYLVVDLMEAIRKTFDKHGYLHKRSNGEEYGGSFLLGYKRKLYTIYDDFQVAKVSCGFSAVGCGQNLALGALHNDVKDGIHKPVIMLERALDAAVAHNAGVSGPYTILSI